MDWKKSFNIGYVILAVALLFLLQDMRDPKHTETIAYSEFKELLKSGVISDVSLGDEVITGSVTLQGLEKILPEKRLDKVKKGSADHRFVTAAVTDPQFVPDLETAGVKFGSAVTNKWLSNLLGWVMPALMFGLVWYFLAKRMGGGMQGGLMEIGKSKAKVYMEKETGVTFADVAGIDEAKVELMEVVEFLKTPDRYRHLGGKIPKGVLIVGAPAAPGSG